MHESTRQAPRASTETAEPAPESTAQGDGGAGGRHDQECVDLDDQQELRHWAQRFHTTEDDLKEAVAQVGPEVRAAGDFLQSGRRPHRDPGGAASPR